jgi:hypothetical protein
MPFQHYDNSKVNCISVSQTTGPFKTNAILTANQHRLQYLEVLARKPPENQTPVS